MFRACYKQRFPLYILKKEKLRGFSWMAVNPENNTCIKSYC